MGGENWVESMQQPVLRLWVGLFEGWRGSSQIRCLGPRKIKMQVERREKKVLSLVTLAWSEM